MKQHQYELHLTWEGNNGTGTKDYRGYRRDHSAVAEGKPALPMSSDPAFRGDRTRYNPEELLVASLSSCHMLWYLHLCSVNGIVVEKYEDSPLGTMTEQPSGAGEFTEVVLRPRVEISAGDSKKAQELHEEAHSMCFIARSVNFPVRTEGTVTMTERSTSA